MGAWVPGRAVPWCLDRLPWIPGAPPGGGSRPQTTRTTSGTRTLEFVFKLMSILVSIFDRFGIDLGSLLGLILGHVGAFFGQSWSWNRLRTDLSSKKCFFTKPFKINGFRRFFTQDGALKRPKIARRRVQDRLG